MISGEASLAEVVVPVEGLAAATASATIGFRAAAECIGLTSVGMSAFAASGVGGHALVTPKGCGHCLWAGWLWRSRLFAVRHSLMPMRMVSMVAASAARRLRMFTPDVQNPGSHG